MGPRPTGRCQCTGRLGVAGAPWACRWATAKSMARGGGVDRVHAGDRQPLPPATGTSSMRGSRERADALWGYLSQIARRQPAFAIPIGSDRSKIVALLTPSLFGMPHGSHKTLPVRAFAAAILSGKAIPVFGTLMMKRVHVRLACAGLLAVSSLGADALRGRILADDGMPLPSSATVRLICDNTVLSTTAIDSEGGFAFEDSAVRSGCDLDATAPGYRRQTVSADGLPTDRRIPAIVLHRLGANQGEAISVSHLAAPEDAVREFHAAVRELRAQPVGDLDAAVAHLRAAVRRYPGYAQAWFELGRVSLAREDVSAAVRTFRNAVRADPWFVSPYRPLILLLRATGEVTGADQVCQGLRRINPAVAPDCGRH